jgi:hypothetical protein
MNICSTKFEHKLSYILNESLSEEGIIIAINKARRQAQLNPVISNKHLQIAAEIQTKQMIKSGTLEHHIKGAKYPNPSDRMQASGYSGGYKSGEVLYSGYDSSTKAIKAWLNSPKHREAILYPDMREIGAASAQDKNGIMFACAILCAPANSNNDFQEIVNKITSATKKYGKETAKRLLTQLPNNIQQSPIIQKLSKLLK